MTEASGLIGRSTPRRDAKRLAEGRGRYTDDLDVANLGHVAFLRSPHAHARILSIDTVAARQAPGVIAVITGEDIAAVCKPWQTRLAPLPIHSSPPQYPLVRGEACWQGEAVVAVVAATRAQAEDALESIMIDWEELPAVPSIEMAGASRAAVVNTAKDTNLGLDHAFTAGNPEQAFASARPLSSMILFLGARPA
jgi:carbon-monoxide dehydrogenase large subunit